MGKLDMMVVHSSSRMPFLPFSVAFCRLPSRMDSPDTSGGGRGLAEVQAELLDGLGELLERHCCC